LEEYQPATTEDVAGSVEGVALGSVIVGSWIAAATYGRARGEDDEIAVGAAGPQRPTKIWVRYTVPEEVTATPTPVASYGPSMFARCPRLASQPRTAAEAGLS
jgi:hypothetical protein